MGISGLLPLLKEETVAVKLSQYKGLTLVVDISCWLHKGSYGCAMELAQGQKTDSKREENLLKGKEAMKSGNLGAARNFFVQSISITNDMVQNVMTAFRQRGVDCIVAPYEADAQITYFVKSGIAHAAVTEDSDLLVFGCQRVLFKLDLSGNAMEVDLRRVFKGGKVFEGFDEEKFRRACILSGCDYLPDGLPGIGLKKAVKVFKCALTNEVERILKRVGTYLKMEIEVSDEYVQEFINAENTFKYSWVFDPLEKRLKPLTEYPSGFDSKSYPQCGPMFSESIAFQVALGNVNTRTMEFVNSYSPGTKIVAKKNVLHDGHVLNPTPLTPLHRLSIWSPNYSPKCAFVDRVKSSSFSSNVVKNTGGSIPSTGCRRTDEAVVSFADSSLLASIEKMKSPSQSPQKPVEWKRLTSNPDDYCTEKKSAQELSLLYLEENFARPTKLKPTSTLTTNTTTSNKASGGSQSASRNISTESTGERIVSRRDSNGSLKENILSTIKRRDGSGPIKRPRASFENSSLQTFEMSSVKKRREETQSLLRQLSECDSNRVPTANEEANDDVQEILGETTPRKAKSLCLDNIEPISPLHDRIHSAKKKNNPFSASKSPAQLVTSVLVGKSPHKKTSGCEKNKSNEDYVPPSRRMFQSKKIVDKSVDSNKKVYSLDQFFNAPKMKMTEEKLKTDTENKGDKLNTFVHSPSNESAINKQFKSPLNSSTSILNEAGEIKRKSFSIDSNEKVIEVVNLDDEDDKSPKKASSNMITPSKIRSKLHSKSPTADNKQSTLPWGSNVISSVAPATKSKAKRKIVKSKYF